MMTTRQIMKTKATGWAVRMIVMVVAGGAMALPGLAAEPVGTSFTYQGQLKSGGVPVEGQADLSFRLYDAATGGTLIDTVGKSFVDVVDGLFTVELDFGPAAFDGNARWLEIRAEFPSGEGNWATLSPRQPVRPAPYALHALNGAESLWSASGANIFFNTGRVGVGTSSPLYTLQVVDDDSTAVGGECQGEGTRGYLGHEWAGVVGESTFANGYGGWFEGRGYFSDRVGIGTSNPAAKLHIGGSAGVDGIMFPDGTLQTTASGGGESLWSQSGSNVYYTAGNVGIGTSSPTESLHVSGDARMDDNVGIGASPDVEASLRADANGTLYGIKAQTALSAYAAMAALATSTSGSARGIIATSSAPSGYGVEALGKVAGVLGSCTQSGGAGVKGTSSSTSGYGGHFVNTSSDGTALYVESAGAGTGDATLQVHNTQPNTGIAAYITSVGSWSTVHARNEGTGEVLWLSRDNADGEFIVAYNEYTGGRVFSVDHDGWTKVSVLEITGGADLSEQFDVASEGVDVEPGMVVAIDAENPGKLVVADRPYDCTVAGVVSGAGGVKPGMLMGQNGTMADGKHPIALTGRVWTLCDASNGAIRPGDLLTTSNVPGHAMKVTDRARAQGAMIGKAMTSLSEGTGLVLVLVSLQ